MSRNYRNMAEQARRRAREISIIGDGHSRMPNRVRQAMAVDPHILRTAGVLDRGIKRYSRKTKHRRHLPRDLGD